MDRIWWAIWSAVNLILLMVVMWVRKRQRRQLAIERENLAIWNASSLSPDKSAELELARQQLATVLGNLRDGVMSLDADLRIELINQICATNWS